MNIRFDGIAIEATDDDLENLGDSLEAIEEGCLALKRRLIDELLVQAEAREQYLARIIRLCHTGQ